MDKLIGQEVVITGNNTKHGHRIGDIVKIASSDLRYRTYFTEDGWCISTDDFQTVDQNNLEFTLNDILNEALVGKNRIKNPDSNNIAEFVSNYLKTI